MYSLINRNLDALLPSIERYGGVDQYADLIGAVRNTVVSSLRHMRPLGAHI